MIDLSDPITIAAGVVSAVLVLVMFGYDLIQDD